MRLKDLLEGYFTTDIETVIKGFSYDSRTTSADDLFFALKGFDQDGHRFIEAAYERGTRYFVVEEEQAPLEGAHFFKTDDARALLSTLSSRFFDQPHEKLTMIGVTGTKGKTTTTNMIKTILDENDIPTGIIGTMGIHFGEDTLPSPNTTPESYVIFHALSLMVKAGMKACVMEVSSGGIQRGRVKDLHFDHGIFLNMGMDHVGDREHPTYEDYKECKGRLFSQSLKSYFNADDPEVDFMKSFATGVPLTFGMKGTDYRLLSTALHKEGASLSQDLSVDYRGEEVSFNVPLPGGFNAYNALAAISVTHQMGISFDDIQKGLSKAKVKGRFEMFPTEDRLFIIDFAHNGVSLETLLKTILSFNPERLGVLIGCIGGRSHIRRKGICEAVRDYADFAVLSEDNPDTEDPALIIEDMLTYFEGSDIPLLTDPNRRSAVQKLVDASKPGDILVLAGKGHETYNIVNHQYLPYSDEETLKEALKKRGLTLTT